MGDRDSKYIQLGVNIILSMLGFILAMVLLLLAVRLLFGLLSYIPWITYLYTLAILLIPASLFTSVYLIFFRRTSRHPSRPVRFVSQSLFIIALIAWAACLVNDIGVFFKKNHTDIAYYFSYNMFFLASNVAMVFIVGLIQALTTEKEKDWLDRPLS